MTLLLSRRPVLYSIPQIEKPDESVAGRDATADVLTRAELAAWYSREWRGLAFHKDYFLDGRVYLSEGQDIEHGAGDVVPAIHAGVIVRAAYSASLGNYVVVKHDSSGHFMTYLHVVHAHGVGHHVAKGGHVAFVAGYNDAHGAMWTGPHLALHFGRTVASWEGIGCLNPLSSIKDI